MYFETKGVTDLDVGGQFDKDGDLVIEIEGEGECGIESMTAYLHKDQVMALRDHLSGILDQNE